ncbi:MAG: hypothetical protein ACPL7B_02190 [Candidatus Poribacteria bacterium]
MKNLYEIFVNLPNEFFKLSWWLWNNEIAEGAICKSRKFNG